jgi:ATP-dependent DNA helicase RecG
MAIAPEVLEANQRSLEEQLASTRMILSPAEPTPTHLGVLTLCDHPRDFLPCAYVQFLKVAGDSLAEEVGSLPPHPGHRQAARSSTV